MTKAGPSRTELGNRLRLAREQAGLSQGQVARMLSLRRPAITEIEGNRRKVSSDELARFADIYKVRIAWLLGSAEDGPDPRVELAARELAHLKREDLDSVLRALKTLRLRDGKS